MTKAQKLAKKYGFEERTEYEILERYTKVLDDGFNWYGACGENRE